MIITEFSLATKLFYKCILDAERSTEYSHQILYDKAVQDFHSHLEETLNSSQQVFNRFSKLILKTNVLRALEPEIVEYLFFNNLLQQIKIDNIIPYIVSLGGNGGSDQSGSSE